MGWSKDALLHHFLLLEEAVAGIGAEAILGLSDFRVYVRRGDRHVLLHPQFLVDSGGVRCYIRAYTPKVRKFIGWLPYVDKRWDLASDKLVFKEAMAAEGISVPGHGFVSADMPGAFLIKRRRSSFSQQVRGPFRRGALLALDVEAGDYAELRIVGQILKIWYWNQHPVCMELHAPPSVRGDGCSSIRELIGRRLVEIRRAHTGGCGEGSVPTFDYTNVECLLISEGKSLDTVLAQGVEQAVELRYTNPLRFPAVHQAIDLQHDMPTDLRAQLLRIGECAWHGIPGAMRANTAYTIDAVLDEHRVIHVLEMNSNPFLHPLIYRVMAPTLFTLEDAQGAQAP